MATLKKGDDENLIYGFDWGTNWLKTGDSIATSVWNVPAGLTDNGQQNDGTIATVKLGGGTIGESYEVVNIITTTISDETAERTLRVIIV